MKIEINRHMRKISICPAALIDHVLPLHSMVLRGHWNVRALKPDDLPRKQNLRSLLLDLMFCDSVTLIRKGDRDEKIFTKI
jgi:hypothetical protein